MKKDGCWGWTMRGQGEEDHQELLRPDACRSRRWFSSTDPSSLSESLVEHEAAPASEVDPFLFRGFHRAPQWKKRRTTWEENPPKWGSVSLCVACMSAHVGVLEPVFKPRHRSIWWGFPQNIDSHVLLLYEQTDQYQVCLSRGSSRSLHMSWQYDKYLAPPRGEFHLLHWLAQCVDVNSWNCQKI